MKKTLLFTIYSRLSMPFRQRVGLFLFFFTICNFSLAASHDSIATVEIAESSVESISDSLSQNSDKGETVKIYVSADAKIYNTEAFQGNVEILHKAKSQKAEKKKTGFHFSKKPAKSYVAKHRQNKEKYTSENQIKPYPLESHNFFSRKGADIIVIPSANPQLKISAIAVALQQTSFIIPVQQKHNPIYMMPLANEIIHWQMRIRPPPAV